MNLPGMSGLAGSELTKVSSCSSRSLCPANQAASAAIVASCIDRR
jgi:hypothetical protein